MSGHSRWVTLKRAINGTEVPYVQGYLLALDDVMEELERIDYVTVAEADLMYEIRREIKKIMGEAQGTLKILTGEGTGPAS